MAKKSTNYILGVDEAGRGCLAGPVVAAAVILPEKFVLKNLTDSKKLSPEQREKLKAEILQIAIDWAVGIVEHKEIDKINIANASYMAMFLAVKQIQTPFSEIRIDGKFFPYKKLFKVPVKCFVKGDAEYPEISAASILAKTFRDKVMVNLARFYPEYAWHSNKGYPTPAHKKAVLKHGRSPYHRKTFRVQRSLFEES